MPNVIREDVISLGFDADLKELTKLQKDVDELKKQMGVLDDDHFKKTKKSADKASDSVSKLSKAAATAGNTLKKVAGVSLKAVSVGVGAAVTAISGLVVKSVSAYAEFEQLKGGVETLFGTNGAKTVEEYAKLTGKSVEAVGDKFEDLQEAQTTVLKNANNAFKTSGLSANDYMTTVTSFSASLISSLNGDTVKAADMADSALVDMADNANKMGTDMGMIQNAYQGFAKQNYTIKSNSRAA